MKQEQATQVKLCADCTHKDNVHICWKCRNGDKKQETTMTARPWHDKDCHCIEKPRDLGAYGERHCTACDHLYRGSVHLCRVHESAPDMLETLQAALHHFSPLAQYGNDFDRAMLAAMKRAINLATGKEG